MRPLPEACALKHPPRAPAMASSQIHARPEHWTEDHHEVDVRERIVPKLILERITKQGHNEDLELVHAAKPIANAPLHNLTITRQLPAVRSNMAQGTAITWVALSLVTESGNPLVT